MTVERPNLRLAETPSPVPRRVLGPLHGREEELRALRHLWHDGARLVCICGAAGVGKTRLALEWGDEVVHAEHLALVNLRPASRAEEVLPLVLSALGITVPRQGGPDGGLRALAAQIYASDVELVVLDNMDRFPEEGRAIVDALLAPPGAVRVAVTSRRRGLFDDVAEVALAPLGLPLGAERGAAWAMFVERARRHLGDRVLTVQEDAWVQQIVAGLEGLPLAIELTAARLAFLGLADIAARLDRALGLAAGPERSLRAALEESWDCLSPRAQDVGARCAVFRCPFTLADAEAVLGEDADAVMDGLQELAGLSLVEMERGAATVFSLHAAVRSFLRERLLDREAGEPGATRSRHARWFGGRAAELVLRAERSRTDAEVRTLAALVPEFRAILTRVGSMSNPDDDLGRAALRAGVGLDVLLQRRGAGVEDSALERLLEAAQTWRADPELRLVLALGCWRRLRGRLSAAQRTWYLDRADEAAAQSGAAVLLGRAASCRAIELWAQGDRDAALVHRSRAMELLESQEDAVALGRARLMGAWMHHDAGNVDRPLGVIAENLRVLEQQERWYESVLHGLNLAALCYQIGAVDAAFDRSARLQSLAGDLGSDYLRAHALRLQASAAILVREDAAPALLSEAEGLSMRLGTASVDAVATLRAWGHLFRRGDADRALALLARVVEHRRRSGAQRMLVYALQSQAEAFLLLEMYDEVAAPVEEALELAVAGNHGPPQIVLRCLLAAQLGQGVRAERELALAASAAAEVDERTRLGVELERIAIAARAGGLGEGDEEVLRLVLRPQPPPGGQPGVDRPLALRSRYMRAATRRVLTAVPGEVRARAWARALDPEARGFLVAGCGRFRLPGGQWLDLTRKGTLARVLDRIASSQPGAVGPEACIAAGWPDERIMGPSATTRLYQVIRRLRAEGLSELLQRTDAGYHIDPLVEVVRTPDV